MSSTHLRGRRGSERTRCGNLIRPAGVRMLNLELVEADPTCGRCRKCAQADRTAAQ